MKTISIIIPTYNEEQNIRKCLDSIFRQNYPSQFIEVILVDNESQDRTLELAANYPVTIAINNEIKDAEVSKMIGLRMAQHELFLYLDADIELVGVDWLSRIIAPHLAEPGIAGSFPRFLPKPSDSALGRYLRYHPLELDPVLRYLSTEIACTVVEEKSDYMICEFQPPKIPPVGICVYRRELLLEVVGRMPRFLDISVPVMLAQRGFDRFVFVPGCGIYHTNVRTLADLVRKRLRNVNKVYLPGIRLANTYKVTYIEKNLKGILKLLEWVVWANLFFPLAIQGGLRCLRYRDWALLYEPVVAIVLTDALVWGFLVNPDGREFFKRILVSKVP